MPEAKSRVVEIVGTPSIEDGYDFHLIVDRMEFEKAVGRAPTSDEWIGKGRYRLYVRDAAALLRGRRKVRVRLSVQPL